MFLPFITGGVPPVGDWVGHEGSLSKGKFPTLTLTTGVYELLTKQIFIDPWLVDILAPLRVRHSFTHSKVKKAFIFNFQAALNGSFISANLY